MPIMSTKIIWGLFAVGVLALGLSIYQLNAALDQTEGRVPPANYPLSTSTPVQVTSTPPVMPPPTPPSKSTVLSVSTVISQASQWDNKKVCVKGIYQNSFEFTALAQNTSPKGYLLKPYIWVADGVDESKLTCTKNQVGQSTCTGETMICGLFEAAAEGEDGFGHVRAYRYQLTDTE